MTPDGRFLVFTSVTDHLTPDDTSTAPQVFEYDAQTGSLVRVSIGQNGYNDNGNTDVAGASILAPSYTANSVGPLTGAVDRYRPMDRCSSRAPMDSRRRRSIKVIGETDAGPQKNPSETLIPVYGNNIYEYHDGNVYLISDGLDVYENSSQGSAVELLGTDESGADVFFTSADQLVPQDTDTNIDIYDARIDGGFPAPVLPPECSGDGCQGPLSSAPTLLSPGSEYQAAGGNVASGVSVSATDAAKAKAKAGRKGAKSKRRGRRRAAVRKVRKAGRSGVARGRAHRKGGRS